MTRRLLKRLAGDRRGATVVEFAMIAPVFLLGMMGLFDLGYSMYTDALLNGAIQQAARNSTIEGSSTSSIDTRVAKVVHDLAPRATLQYKRTSYTNFSDVSQPEDFTDIDGDGVCANGEPFEDANGNGAWDTDRGLDGLGGARDAVLYEVTITYPRPFPVAGLIGQPTDFTMKASTVLRNQPYGLQGARGGTGNCS